MFSEVILGQVLSLELSSGMEAVKCTGRTDLTLSGSFADMILVPSAGTTGSNANASLFVLSNPGCIQIYSSDLQPWKDVPVSAVNFPVTIPTVDPLITVAALFYVNGITEGLGSKVICLCIKCLFLDASSIILLVLFLIPYRLVMLLCILRYLQQVQH